MFVLSADATEALTLATRKTAWLLNSSWEDIRTGLLMLPDDVKSLVNDELEDRLTDAWDDLRRDDDPTERPPNWLPNDGDYGPPPFNSDWMGWQGSRNSSTVRGLTYRLKLPFQAHRRTPPPRTGTN